MKTIWKFPLGVADEQTIEMPQGAKVLAVQVQGEQVCVWVLVDPHADKERRTFYIVGTGHDLWDDWGRLRHLGTFQLRGGALVFHVFEPPRDFR